MPLFRHRIGCTNILWTLGFPPVSLDSLLTGGFAINSHNAADASVYTACGNIPTSESITVGGIQPTTVQLIAVSELSDSGQSGWAKLTAKDDDTEVAFNLSWVSASSSTHGSRSRDERNSALIAPCLLGP